jgi:aminobenzoyl-glutamate utilization protein B
MGIARSNSTVVATLVLLHASAATAQQSPPPGERSDQSREALKQDVIGEVEELRELTQQIVDSVFSFSEIGFQEFETQRYLTAVLERNGFTVQRGVAGIPTSWIATWGSGGPVVALSAPTCWTS